MRDSTLLPFGGLRRAIVVLWMILCSTLHSAEPRIAETGLRLIHERDVAAQESGPVMKVLVQEGQQVKAGMLLATIEDEDARIELERAEISRDNARELATSDIALRSSQQTLKLAELDRERAQSQAQRFPDTVSAAQLDRLRIELERAKLDVEQARKQEAVYRQGLRAAENEVRAAKRGVARRKIVAPMDGVVVEVQYQPGEWVKAGDTVVRLVDVRSLRAEGFVDASADAPDLVGRTVAFVVDNENEDRKRFPGKVVFVSPEANPVTRQLRIWAEIENPHRHLQPGLAGGLILVADSSDSPTTDRISGTQK